MQQATIWTEQIAVNWAQVDHGRSSEAILRAQCFSPLTQHDGVFLALKRKCQGLQATLDTWLLAGVIRKWLPQVYICGYAICLRPHLPQG